MFPSEWSFVGTAQDIRKRSVRSGSAGIGVQRRRYAQRRSWS